MTTKWTFGCEGWRIESTPDIVTNISNLKLYAEDKLVFEGTYGDLIRKIEEK